MDWYGIVGMILASVLGLAVLALMIPWDWSRYTNEKENNSNTN